MKTNPNHSHHTGNHDPSKRGFTLVELLVCIAMIATLAIIAFFFSSKAKSKAMQVNAMKTLRELAVGNAAFSVENSGKINTLRDSTDPEEGKPHVANSYWGRMEPYLFSGIKAAGQPKLKDDLRTRLEQFLGTPNPNKMTGTFLQGAKIYHDGSGLPVPFGFNKSLYPYGKWTRTSQIGDPAQVMYATYGFYMVTEAKAGTYQPRPTDGTSKPVYFMDNGKAMVVFLDGHTESVSAPFPERMFE